MIRPEDRYDNLEIKTLENGQKVYNSARLKFIPINPLTDISIPATDTARLDMISNNVYGTSMLWWKIAAANGKINGSLYFKPGEYITIPK